MQKQAWASSTFLLPAVFWAPWAPPAAAFSTHLTAVFGARCPGEGSGAVGLVTSAQKGIVLPEGSIQGCTA